MYQADTFDSIIVAERGTNGAYRSLFDLLRRTGLSSAAVANLIMVGALGGPRVDHALVNVGLLAMPGLTGRSATIVDERARIRLIRAPGLDGAAVERRLAGRPGDLVSLLPLGDGVEGVTTDGLLYALADEPLPSGRARGLSNVRVSAEARVVVRRGLLLVVETPATL